MATDASAAGMISLAGRTVPRMGFGAMGLRGSVEPEAAFAVLRRSIPQVGAALATGGPLHPRRMTEGKVQDVEGWRNAFTEDGVFTVAGGESFYGRETRHSSAQRRRWRC